METGRERRRKIYRQTDIKGEYVGPFQAGTPSLPNLRQIGDRQTEREGEREIDIQTERGRMRLNVIFIFLKERYRYKR